ncbi:MAG TPA: OPT/YSL family transporter, partial [Candidatus Xenobia bacterium]
MPPATEEEIVEAERPATPDLPDPDKDPELHWFRTVYQGDNMPQLTFRAVVMGSFLGVIMCASNMYVGLKTGWGLGVAITACIMSFAIYKTLRTAFPRWFGSDMSLLENNCMQSTAQSAGSSVCSVTVSAIPAYLMLTHTQMAWPVLGAWVFFLAVLGVFLAVPMKRQMINVEQLKFPSGTAAAETLRSLHSEGGEAMDKAKSLGWAGLFGIVLTWFRDSGWPASVKWLRIPSMLPFPGRILGIDLAKYTIYFDMSSIMVAAGAIMGWKIAWSLLLGATINYAWLAPWMIKIGAIDPAHLGYREIVRWSTWTGASMMVTSGLLMFFMQWRTILTAFSGIADIFGKKVQDDVVDPMARIEVPNSWFVTGVTISGVALAYM